MGKVKNLHWSMKDKEDWTDEDWKMYFHDMRYNEETARQQQPNNDQGGQNDE
jgi:hypothetical protein